MGTESPKRNAFALGFSLPLASFFRVTETKTLFGLGFGPPLATALIRAEKWGVLSPQKLYYQEKRTLVQTACLFDPVNHLLSSAHM